MDPAKKRKLDENGIVAADASAGLNQISLEDARKIIQPFTHEQLLEIVQNAALRHADVLDAVRSIADRDPTQRKLFIRGLGWDTTTEKLRALFSTYGDLEEGAVILDKTTGKSKGYGFVTFKHVDGALLALKEPSKRIDGRMTVTQLAAVKNPGGGGPMGEANHAQPKPGLDASNRKIYVANVPYDMPAERLLAHFLAYGEIEEGPLGFDKATGKSRGFALFVYKTAEGARASLVDPIKTIDGHQMTCKFANDGKKGGVAPGMLPAAAAPTLGAGPAGAPLVEAAHLRGGDGHGIGVGMHPQSSFAAAAQYGGGLSGGLQGPPLGHHALNSPVGGGPGLSGVGSLAPSSLAASGGYGSGLGGPYGGSHYGGPASTGYGGLAAAVAGGLGGSSGNLAGAGRGSSLYGLPPSSGGMASGSFPESAHYSLSSSGHPNQPTGTLSTTRVPPGGMYQGGPPYY
ncbi:UBP1-associated protein 2C-like [Diospyros lotus]|uniref:UBP1-associated protein 2C-like n=1 Tax=Diospyros lotus TaxID=55363 RepID=UPI00224CA742|nr:UBP1-associated protein 2C-like [Diospyros lotus]XP_052207749.1 UBP1-associated protein 2C-like [Diospyros lotus]XP_052207751.1 UBP1-associated protein 2C-like [Diospyros lotus]XP_052207752.1 UBP1-associated protein 2C-like [Diospyros lotus]